MSEEKPKTPKEVLEKLKAVPDLKKIRKELPPKEEIEKKVEKEITAEVKKLSQILTERKGKQVLQKAYLDSFECNVEYGDPTLSEFMQITRTARESGDMDNFVFDLIIAMFQKADPAMNRPLLESIDGAEALEMLQVMVKDSPFFKRLSSLQKEGTFLMR